MKEIIKNIISQLDQAIENQGEYVVFGDYEPVKFSEGSFREIPDTNSNKKIVFIDGGNSELLRAPNFSLQCIRIYHAVYQQNRKIKQSRKEFFVLITAEAQENKIAYKITPYKTDLNFKSVDSFDKNLKQGEHRVDISAIGAVCRKLAEIKTAEQAAEELVQGDIIVRDGDLEPETEQEKEYYTALFEKALAKNIIICGISKTTNMLTNTGNSAGNVINSFANLDEWCYHPVFKNTGAEVCFVKLNKNSKYVFRFDILKEQFNNTLEVLGLLKQNAKDPVFLGYPYGLVEADRFARVSSKDSEYFKTIIATYAGKDYDKIRQCMIALDAHSVLDKIG